MVLSCSPKSFPGACGALTSGESGMFVPGAASSDAMSATLITSCVRAVVNLHTAQQMDTPPQRKLSTQRADKLIFITCKIAALPLPASSAAMCCSMAVSLVARPQSLRAPVVDQVQRPSVTVNSGAA